MLRRSFAVIAFGVVVGAGGFGGGCASGGDNPGLGGDDASFDGVPPAPDTGAGDGTGGRGDAGDGGNTGDAGDAAQDGGATSGMTGSALAAGATVSNSPAYQMFWTLGQGPGGNETSHSPHYQIRGGVVGATQKP